MRKSYRATMLIPFFLAACGPSPEPPAKMQVRQTAFKECMELAAKMPRQADDDVSDIVDSCHAHAARHAHFVK